MRNAESRGRAELDQAFDIKSGNILQKAIKFHLKPRNPSFTKRTLEYLGVPIFRKCVNQIPKILRKDIPIKQSNHYTLNRYSLDSLLNFVIYGTLFNECVHTVSYLLALYYLFQDSQFKGERTALNISLVVLGLIVFMIDNYIHLLQRYNRAEMYLLIEKQRNAFPNSHRMKLNSHVNLWSLNIPDDWKSPMYVEQSVLDHFTQF